MPCAWLGISGEVTDDELRPAFHESAQTGCAVLVPGIHDDVVAVRQQAVRCSKAEAVCGPGDKDSHGLAYFFQLWLVSVAAVAFEVSRARCCGV